MPEVEKIMPTRTILNSPIFQEHKTKRVAAYARVSTDSDEQYTSFEAQVDYYTRYIGNNPDWEFVKVYADEGVSGTSTTKRKGFNEMLTAARHHKFDLLLTKSISRFARNTVDSLNAIRELKELGIDIYFEEQKLNTMNATGELIITILSAIAQEESRNISENVSWGIRKSFSDGKVMLAYKRFLGYEKGKDGKPVIVEEEAEVVRKIYNLFLTGSSCNQIADYLNDHKIPMPSKKTDANGEYLYKWQVSTVRSILRNEKYKGEAILQKSYTKNYLTHEKVVNDGTTIPIYHVRKSHEHIIPIEEWEMVQVEHERRSKLPFKYSGTSIFASKLVCSDCGGYYGQKVWHSNSAYRKTIYQCNHKFKGDKHCNTPTLTEEQIIAAFIESFNKINKEDLADDCLIQSKKLMDVSGLDARILQLTIDADAINALAKEMIEKNKREELNQDEYEKKYKVLQQRAKVIKEELLKLDKQRSIRIASAERIKLFATALQNNQEEMTAFDTKRWTMLLEKATVYPNRTIKFTYYAGYENTVEIK